MRKIAASVWVLLLASIIDSGIARAGSPVFFNGMGSFHQPAFLNRQVFINRQVFVNRQVFFNQPFFPNRSFFSFFFVGFPAVIPAPLYYYPPYYYPPYAYPSYAPTTVIQQTPEPAPTQYWYYCDTPQGYYIPIQSGSTGWRQVPTTPPPPPRG
jgi:hypothetical protein